MKPLQPSFEFSNNVSPKYIEPLFLRIEPEQWYSTGDLVAMLQASGLDVEGSNIAQYNTAVWSLAGLGEVRKERRGRSQTKLFRLSSLGRQVQDTYSTNSALFYDLMHYFFYSTWQRSRDIRRARFWLYASVCDDLWQKAPEETDFSGLTNSLQSESRQSFPDYAPSFPRQSIHAVFRWLVMLTPPFLARCGERSQLCSNRRGYCTPQLFHLAADMVYASDGLAYGTSMALDDSHIEAISRACLLDPLRFWEMADLTKSAINGFQIRKGQWGVSIALDAPPDWIALPDFSQEPAGPEETLLEEERQE
jgi:hypothetical protein